MSLVPDNLHTLSKGLIEYCISWTMCCLLTIKDIDKDNFGFNIIQLDNRIKKFPTIQSLSIFSNKYMVRFGNGISHLFKTSWNKKKLQEVWKNGNYLNYYFKLFFALTREYVHLILLHQKTILYQDVGTLVKQSLIL